MAIGPPSWRDASGRIVVIAGLQGILGAAATVIGIGPLLIGAPIATQGLAGVTVVVGGVLIASAAALGWRARQARLIGTLGAAGTVLLGLMLAGASLASGDECELRAVRESACTALLGSLEVAGVAIAAAGVGSLVIIRRARPHAFRRHRR